MTKARLRNEVVVVCHPMTGTDRYGRKQNEADRHNDEQRNRTTKSYVSHALLLEDEMVGEVQA